MENLEDILKKKSAAQYEKFSRIKEQAKDILPKIRIPFPEYNNHDIKHAEVVEKNLNYVIPDNIKENLNSDEIFCLLCGAWLHDTGMILDLDEEKKYLNADADGKKDFKSDVRNNHHIRSYNFIMSESTLDFDHKERKIIAYISRGHRNISIQDELHEKFRIGGERGSVRLQLLAALLRLADECDITSDRVSEHYIEEQRLTWNFIPHVKKHELIDEVFLSEDTKSIVIGGHVSSDTDLNILKRSKKDIEGEINLVEDILHKNDIMLQDVKLSLDCDKLYEKKIISCLLDRNPKTQETITSELKTDEVNVKRILENLSVKKIVIENENVVPTEYKISNDFKAFKTIFELFFADELLKEFINYPYCENFISNHLLGHLINLYNCIITDNTEKTQILEILRKSPTAIYLALHGMEILSNQDLEHSLFQGRYLLNLLLLIGFYYDMYRYPLEIGDIEEFIKDFLNPLCNEVCKNLPDITRFYDEVQKSTRKNYTEKMLELASEKSEGPIKIGMRIISSKNEPDLTDLLIASRKTGYPFQITAPRIKGVTVDEKEKNFLGIEFGTERILNLNLRLKGDDFGFDNLKFRPFKKGGFLVITTDNRNHPFFFEFGFNFEQESGSLSFKVLPPTDAVNYFKIEEFVKKLNENNRILFTEPNSNRVIFGFNAPKIRFNQQWYEIFRKLCFIQKKTGQKILFPEEYEFESKDIQDTNRLYELLKEGKTELPVNNVSTKIRIIDIKNMFKILEENKDVPFAMVVPDYSIEIAKNKVKIGPVKSSAPSFDIIDKDELSKLVESMDDMDSLEIKLLPKDEKIQLSIDITK